MTISVIIPAYRPRCIKECISAILNSGYKPSEIILVDDNSGIDYYNDVKQYCKIIKLDKRFGPAKARNIGAFASDSDLLCFIDSDVIIFQNTLGLIKSVFEKNLGISAVQTICIDNCRFNNFASQYQNLYFYFNIKTIKEEYLATIIGHCFAVKNTDFHSVGGFDESIKDATVEDGNFGLSLYRHNKLIYLDKNIEVEHMSYLSISKVIKKIFIKSSDKIYTLLRDKSLFKINPNKTEHSKMKIVSVLASLFLVLSLIVSAFFLKTLFISLIILLVYLICSWQFIYFCFQKKGLIFAIKVAAFHYVNCLFSSLGLSYGLFRFLSIKNIK